MINDPNVLIDALNTVINTPGLIEIGRKAVEDVAIEMRDSRLSQLNRGNGIVCREASGEPSAIIRFGPETAILVALRAMVANVKV